MIPMGQFERNPKPVVEEEFPSLRAHLIGMLGIFAALFLGLTLYLYLNSRSIVSEALEHDLSGDLNWTLSILKNDPGLFKSPRRADSLCHAISGFKGFRITFIDSIGRVIADSHVLLTKLESLENHADRPEIKQARVQGTGYAWRHSNTVGTTMLYVARQLPNHSGYVRGAAGPTALESFQKASLRIFTLFLALFLAASLAVTFWISRKISTPLLNLLDSRTDGSNALTPQWEAEFREAGILNRAFQGYVQEIRKLGIDVLSERDKLVSVLFQLEEGIVILNSDGKILAANPASLRLLCVEGGDNSPQAIVGCSAKDVLVHKNLIDWIGIAQDTERPPILHIDKGPRVQYDLLCHLAPLASTTGTSEYLLTVINVTEFRHLDRIKSEFVANASHELKTPLSSIKGFAEALLEGALEDEKVRGPFIRKIHNNAIRLERLIQDLLSLSQLEANTAPKETEPLPLRGYVNAAVSLHRENLDAQGIRLENHIPDDLRILMEPRDLELILNNLVGNAVKYNKPAGKVKIWVDLGESLKLSIKDTGIGISEEMLPRIFERFYRAGASRATKEGTGLGLAIVKHAANKYGMTVLAESTLGEGSRFLIDIPITLMESKPDFTKSAS